MVTQCAYCGRPLKNPKSQTEGIGPVCKRKGVDRAEAVDKQATGVAARHGGNEVRA